MTDQTPHYEAETCHTGGHLCGHRHRTRKAAERCLPATPRNNPGSPTQYFSLARVEAMNDAAREQDEQERERAYHALERYERAHG